MSARLTEEKVADMQTYASTRLDGVRQQGGAEGQLESDLLALIDDRAAILESERDLLAALDVASLWMLAQPIPEFSQADSSEQRAAAQKVWRRHRDEAFGVIDAAIANPTNRTRRGAKMPDQTVGMINKYRVERVDGKPVGWCFVLEDKDPLALRALSTYSRDARIKGFIALADDLDVKIDELLGQDAPTGAGGGKQ